MGHKESFHCGAINVESDPQNVVASPGLLCACAGIRIAVLMLPILLSACSGTASVPSGERSAASSHPGSLPAHIMSQPLPPLLRQHSLQISVSGAGAVSLVPGGLQCRTSCSSRFTPGQSVVLTATADDGFQFTGWSGACSGTNATCTLSITSELNVTAAFAPQPPAALLCAEITRHSVTFAFDKAYPCGTFANGDYWVTPTQLDGSVAIISITPAYTGAANGFEVNPSSVTYQGFDSTAADFDPSIVPALPYSARAGQSVVKAISLAGDDKTSLDTAVVLTVLGAVPPDNGASVFRPPYFGVDKPLYSTTNLRMDRLPRLAAIPGTPTLADLNKRFERLQLDHQLWWSANRIHPKQNMPNYGASIATDTAVAALRLMIDDDAVAKRMLAIRYSQYGIDLAAARRGGLHFNADGGHRLGRKLVLTLTSLLLDDAGIAALVRDAPYGMYQEDGQLYYSATAGKVLFGKQCTESDYWHNQNTGSGSRDCRDPYGYIDGGEQPGLGYQFCCTAKPYKATALVLRLMPDLRCVWTGTDLIDYADRWVAFGTWAQPDPYAPHGNGAPDTNAANGTGRWPELHGTNADGGYYGEPFADAMWASYRAVATGEPNCTAADPRPGAGPRQVRKAIDSGVFEGHSQASSQIPGEGANSD